MLFGKLVILTVGITIISLPQLFLTSLNLDLAESSVLYLHSGNGLERKVESSDATLKTIDSKFCEQAQIVECLPLLSMSSGKPISEIDAPMKIIFRQSGGYTGVTKGCEINTELLEKAEAEELKSYVEQSGILETQTKLSNTADAYNYRLVIETVKQTYRVSFNEQDLSKEAIPLIEFLEERSDYIKSN